MADLYTAYLQRGPDDGGLGWWTGQVPGSGRANVCNAFEGSSEFATLVATLYGTATSDNERTEHYVNNFYLGAYGRNATSTELQQQRDALNAAAAQGPSQVQAQAESFGRSLFALQVNDAGISNAQFVTNLYEAFLQRGPDAGGLAWWSGQATVGQGRQNVLGSFATCGPFYELAGTLYREAFWLVSDRLGTPRMIVNKSGSLASVKRHDYLPFGEEIGGPQVALLGGRTTAQGYTGDSVRQHFTGYEADAETGLNFAQARYQSSVQGRFTSVDPLGASASVTNPQSFNRYSYVQNDPLNHVDPSGMAMADITNAEEQHDKRVGEARALKAVNDALKAGNLDLVRSILAANPSVGYEMNSSYNPTAEGVTVSAEVTGVSQGTKKKFEPGRVYRCNRKTNFNGVASIVNSVAIHFWLRTDEKEAGLGRADGGVPGQDGGPDSPGFTQTAIVDHKGQADEPGASCELIEGADPKIVNRELEIGKHMGTFNDKNNCYNFAYHVIEKAGWKDPYIPPIMAPFP